MTSFNREKCENTAASGIVRIENQVKLDIPSEFDSLSDVHGMDIAYFCPLYYFARCYALGVGNCLAICDIPYLVALGVLLIN